MTYKYFVSYTYLTDDKLWGIGYVAYKTDNLIEDMVVLHDVADEIQKDVENKYNKPVTNLVVLNFRLFDKA